MPIVVSNLDQTLDVNEDLARELNSIILSDASGELEFSVRLELSNPAAGVIILDDDADTTHALVGDATFLNGLLANARFMPAANWNGEVSITVTVETPGETPEIGAIDITVTAVNDAPSATVPGAITAAEDAATALTGISFSDVDAGGGSVTATFSLPVGALSAMSGGGVTVDGTANALTLAGTIADINAFIASGGLIYTADGPTDTTLTVSIRDSGNTGVGGALTDTATVAINIDDTNSPPTGAVVIHGAVIQGQTLTAISTLADADGMGEVTYQWRADGADIDGADGEAFVLTQDQVGKVITVVASYEDDTGHPEAATSSPSVIVANVNDAPTGAVATSGLAQVGRTLTADTSALGDLDGLGEFSYQWRVDGENVGDAASLVLHADMVGKSITVSVTYEDGYGTEETLTSGGVTVAAAPPPAPPRNIETTTIGGRTITTEIVVGPDGIPRQTLVTAPNSDPNASALELALLARKDALLANLPTGFGLTATGPTSAVNFEQLLSQASPDVVRSLLEARLAMEAENDTFLQNLQFSFGQFQDNPDPIALIGSMQDFIALTISTIGAIPPQIPSGLPTINLSYIDFALIAGQAKLVGGAGRQLVFGDDARQSMVLGEGDDELHGGGGADTVGSQAGDDSLFGDAGEDSVFGGEGGDQLFGGLDRDTVQGNVGADFVQGNQGDDLLYGGQGDDIVRGGQGNDFVLGDLGNDLVFGDLGNDTLQGGDGADTLSAGPGDDVLTGGGGADVFLLSAGNGVDRVTDFTSADHVILAQGVAFTLRQEGADTVIDLGTEGRMILTGVQFSALPEGWLTVA